MTLIHISNMHFDFTFVRIGRPDVTAQRLMVPIKTFSITAGYPGYERDTFFESCVLVYNQVLASTRIVLEYEVFTETENRGFKPKYVINDGPFVQPTDPNQLFTFRIGCISDELRAWVQWEILAASVHLENEKIIPVRYKDDGT